MKRLFLLLGLLLGFSLSSEAKTDTIYFEFKGLDLTDKMDYYFSTEVLNGGVLIEYSYNDGSVHRISPNWVGSINLGIGSGYVRIYYTNSSQTEYTIRFTRDDLGYSHSHDIEISYDFIFRSVDVHNCSLLTTLNCKNAFIPTLDVSGCSALKSLYCNADGMTTLNVNGCSALEILDCGISYNSSWVGTLTTLDVSSCSALTYLNCRVNKLTSLDIRGCPALKSLYCDNNQLTDLGVSGHTALKSLYCDNNQLTNLDVSGCSALTDLYCRDNKLTSLNASGCSSIGYLSSRADDGNLRGNDSLTNLNVSGCTALWHLYCDSLQLTSLDVGGCSALESLYCSGNQLTSLNASGCSVLKTFNFSGNNALTSLNVSGCSALASLSCNNLQLTSLDVSGCSSMTDLNCSDNQLTSLNASDCSVLKTFNFSGNNALTSLNVSGCTSLTSFSYNNSQLTSLNVSGCSALTYLDCQNSQLTSLNVRGCSALTYLDCQNNQLTSLDVSGCSALTRLSCFYNQLTSLDVSGCSALESLYCRDNELTSLDVSGCSALTELSCYGNQLTDLDVSGCSALTELSCYNNQLTSLDMIGCSALERLDCYDNQLTSLDVIGCSVLERLDCYDNQLTSLDVSGCSVLERLDCYDNQLTTLDVSGCSALAWLWCYDNHIPLSTLYNIYIQSSDWTWFSADPQSDSITLLVGEALDLSSEGNLGGNTTDVRLYLDDQYCYNTEDYYTENNFCFLFHRPNEYRLELRNYSAISSQFSYYLSVKLPDGYFGIYVNANSKNMGTASISGNGSYQEGTEVTITATPANGYRFVNWTKENGEVFSTEAEHTFTATENLELTANFEENTFTLNCYTNNSEWGSTYGAEGTYFEGEEVTIYASPYYHCHFVNWTKADGSVFSTEAEYTFIITEDLELTANFEQDPTFTLALHVNNPEWGSTSGYNDTYYEGEEVTIYASPNYGYHFVNWTKADGSVFSTEAEYTFIITEDLELTANFAPDGGVDNENHQDNNFSLYVQDRTICLSENRGAVQVFNTTGQCIYNGFSTRIPAPHSGVYIVKVGTRSYKVMIR